MKVIDLLQVIDECCDVHIIEDSQIVSTYDGKNSIDEQYNNKEVICIGCNNFISGINIFI